MIKTEFMNDPKFYESMPIRDAYKYLGWKIPSYKTIKRYITVGVEGYKLPCRRVGGSSKPRYEISPAKLLEWVVATQELADRGVNTPKAIVQRRDSVDWSDVIKTKKNGCRR